ncbi:Nose resistant to fluoxetine protein 6 [Orchesella cincta]|uniref:Nose resistant to fluoxetine protein 6 n=1 Tax=Orchesella cincta TaxID=48709 RepID=A0A1D2MRM3_ORCCI|nr:Nose resistant to fluoxetine protein 6 [Orchesella cincta]
MFSLNFRIIQPLWNIVDTYSLITTSVSILFITNAAIVVDVFFVIGGFLVSLTLLAMLEKTRGSMKSMPMVYLHRYLRITPMYMIIVAFATFVFPLMGSGPYWHVTKTWAGFCEKNWWKNLLYINNLPIYDTVKDPLDAPCHGMAWYLGVDMQLFILSPFLLFPIWKWKRFGVVPLALLTIASIITPGVITFVNDYPPTNVPFQSPTKRYSQEAYTPTYMRAAPYLIGMWAGIFFRKMRKLAIKKNYRLGTAQVLGAWFVAFTTGFAVLLSPHRYMDPEYDFQKGESAVFVSGQRTAWAVAISWLIFACASGYGGWINQILSWRPFIPLGRLTFAIYLVSMNLQFLFHLQYRQPIYFTNYHMVNLYFGHLVMSCLVAVVCTLVIEAPFMQLLKMLLPTGAKRKSSKFTCSNNNDIIKGELPRTSVSPDPSGRQIGSVSTLSANSREVLIHT